MSKTYAELNRMYYDNQTDTWNRIRQVSRISQQLEEEKENNSYTKFFRLLFRWNLKND